MAAWPGGVDDDNDDGDEYARRDACRLFLGNLPKAKTEQDIRDEVGRATPGLVRVITYKDAEDPRLHRGFCFLDYESAAVAADALHRLSWNPVFGCRAVADWADPEPETDADVMARVRILFVRQYCGGGGGGGAMRDETALAAAFGRYGVVERVKCLKNYAFVHFARRDDARAAMEALDGTVDADTGVRTEVSWAKPPADKTARERALRDRQRRMLCSVGAVGRRGSRAPAVVPANGAGHAYTGDNYDHYVYDFGANLTWVDRDARPRQSGRRCGHSDCADVDGHGDDVDVDDKIRKFFLKVTVGGILGRTTPDGQ